MLDLRVFMAQWWSARFLPDASATSPCHDLQAGKRSNPEEGSGEG